MIGTRIQEILDKKGMTQVELAQKTGMSVAQINRIVNGWSEPDKTVAKIAQALDVPVHALYSEDAQIAALAIKSLESFPIDIVKAFGDKKKLDYLLLGLNLSDSELSPEEIKLCIEERENYERKVRELKGK